MGAPITQAYRDDNVIRSYSFFVGAKGCSPEAGEPRSVI